MLSYAFQILQEEGYRSIAAEEFDNTAELCAEILAKGVAVQIKRGLRREYITQKEPRSAPKGKLEITDSLKDMTVYKKQLVCTYDDFSVNSYMNSIIKSTMVLLLRADIAKKQKKKLKKLLVYFQDVDELDVHRIHWNMHYNRNNQTYRMLISICHLVVKGLLQTTQTGTQKVMHFFDEQRMHRLYEKFILEYYRKELPQVKATASQIPWQLDNHISHMLPVMQSDIMLSYQEKTLIIDAKYYAKITRVHYDNHILHSANLYQIFTYVKNKDAELEGQPHEVSGLLLYAKTDSLVVPHNEYSMSGNRIGVETLDLNCDFSNIAGQLNRIAHNYLGVEV